MQVSVGLVARIPLKTKPVYVGAILWLHEQLQVSLNH